MTNVEIVRNSLTKVPGNKRFGASNLVTDQQVNLTVDQVGKVLRTQKHVKRVGSGQFMVKGRKV